MKPKKKKPHRFFRLTKIQSYLLIKTIKKKLKEQEKRLNLSK